MNIAYLTVVCDLLAGVCASVFIGMYARRRWWASRTGFNLMCMSIAVLIAAVLAAASWAVVASGKHNFFTWLAPVAALTWLVIAGGFIARIGDLRRSEKNPD